MRWGIVVLALSAALSACSGGDEDVIVIFAGSPTIDYFGETVGSKRGDRPGGRRRGPLPADAAPAVPTDRGRTGNPQQDSAGCCPCSS